MRSIQEFKIGEEVKISRPEVCYWGCASEMRAMKGKIAKIRRVRWLDAPGRWEYTVSGDRFCYSWSADCFDSVYQVFDLPDFTPARSIDLQALFQ